VQRFAIHFFGICIFGICGQVFAQPAENPFRLFPDSETGIVGQFENFGGNLLNSPVEFSAKIIPATASQPAILAITANVAPKKHLYSITQPPGGPLPTRIELVPSSDYQLRGPFLPDPEPTSHVQEGPVWKGLEIQEHEGQVTWYAPIEITAGVDPAKLEISGTIRTEVCETGGTCEPVEKQIAARLATDAIELPAAIAKQISASKASPEKMPPAFAEFQLESSAVKFRGQLVPSAVRPGESASLEFTAILPKGGRLYALADRDERVGTKPTLIAVESAAGLAAHRASTNSAVKVDDSVPQFGRMEYHEGTVTWTMPITVPADAKPGDYPIRGQIGYQACEYGQDGNNICELPNAIRFEANLQVGDKTSTTPAPIAFSPGDGYSKAAALAASFASSLDSQSPPATADAGNAAGKDDAVLSAGNQFDIGQVRVEQSNRSIAYYIALAFVGGLILNLMPCVLPVIGLKVMSFVEQAGKSRTHALVLNLWFAAGIVGVFLLLGVLAATLNLSWGGQFGSTPFNVTIAAVVFAMALSLLGVWEVPIPGFFGSGSVQAVAAQEGPLGAFLKGVVTTVLATPCTAPFMAPAIAWAVTQSATTTLAVFASLGLGMASPYIVVGVFPELLRFLPKPGAWMETFKQISGFVLLGTVVFILSFLEPAAVVPTIALLLGIGVACWLVARTPLTAELGDRLRSWAYAGAVILLFVAVSFGWLYRVATAAPEVAWQPFSLERLKQVAVDDGKTVIVDFSADWCINCKVLEQTVLHTEPVEQAIERTGAVTMYADFTKYPPEIDRVLKGLGANGVPVIAIFPGGNPYEPKVFRGVYTQQGLVDALEEASGKMKANQQSVAEAPGLAPPLN
jgi:suppressor for copper-sensitivity B